MANIIKDDGNYGEIFERNVGAGSPLKIARGVNALWTKGGLQYGTADPLIDRSGRRGKPLRPFRLRIG